MKIETLARIEFIFILLVVGSLFFVAGKKITGMVIHDKNETNEKIYDKIKEGMNMEEVKAIAGEPLDRKQMESMGVKTEIWYYKGKIQVIFMDGFVNSKAKY